MAQSERRLHYRLPIRVPIFLKGIDKAGNEFFELTHTIDVSASGACFLAKSDVVGLADLLVSIPAPVDIDSGSPDNYQFKFPAKVVRVENGLVGSNRKVSVRFSKLLYEKQ
ncbi:MAG: PilZ domain-containing protein [Acidobacteriota bacterium]